MIDSNESKSSIGNFFVQTSSFGTLMAESLRLYFQQESESESELVNTYLNTFEKIFENIGTEVTKAFQESDGETQATIEKYIFNSNVNEFLKSANSLLSKKSKILGIIEKIMPILEIVKKAIYQVIELFPGFISKFLKKILTPLLELLDNIGLRILDLFGLTDKSASFYLKSAEEDFLNTHPKWRQLQFESY